MSKFAVFACVLQFCATFAASQVVITSPPITDWGAWAPTFQPCPVGKAVKGFQLKQQGPVGLLDDTAMNGLMLICDNFGLANITSSVGNRGEWRNVFRCSNDGYVNGFQLRVEAPDVSQDETATNNIRVFCTTGDAIEGDGGSFGIWGQDVHCPENLVVCALKTQVQDTHLLSDDTALNNIAMECCTAPS